VQILILNYEKTFRDRGSGFFLLTNSYADYFADKELKKC
jgi:hypothetical protein